MTGRHRTDKLGPPDPDPGQLPPDAASRVRPYVPLPAPTLADLARQGDTRPDWDHFVDATDFLAAYDAHLAPLVRSLVWAYYRDAAGDTETSMTAAIARTR